MIDIPKIETGFLPYWRAWSDLSTCRGDGTSFVPWTAIDQYCARAGWDWTRQSVLVKVCRALDEQVNEHILERMKSK